MSDVPQTASGSVTVHGKPIVVDWQCQLRSFLDRTLPSTETLFARWQHTAVPPNPLQKNSQTLESPYPPLPCLRLGELQWPSGASRYARALFAVDEDTMWEIAKEAWGYEFPTEVIDPEGDPEDPENKRDVKPTDVPENWGGERYPVEVQFHDGTHTFKTKMHPLPPYRVTGSGVDLWLIPLVDERFFMQRKAHTKAEDPIDWEQLFSNYSDDLEVVINDDAVPTAYKAPCWRLWADDPAAILLDHAALSVSMRVVSDPETGQLHVLNQYNSEHRREANIEKLSEWMLAGGLRGIAAKASGVDVYCQRCDDHFEKHSENIPGSTGGVKLSIWSSWRVTYEAGEPTNLGETLAFVSQVASDLAEWWNAGGQFCAAGCIDYRPSGYDDYYSICVEEQSSDQYNFTCLIKELPPGFLPPALLVGGIPDQGIFFRFRLKEDFEYGIAKAAITSGSGEVVATNEFVRDPLGIFAELEKGASGYAIKSQCQYFAIQAPCQEDQDEEEEEEPPTEDPPIEGPPEE